jgi:terminase large subunit-like protein
MIETHDLATCCWCGAPFVRGLVSILGLSPWTCPTEACWRRQVALAMVVTVKGRPRQDLGGNKRCRFVPLPRQVEAMEALTGSATYIMIGGAAGGSKSKGLREIAHATCMTRPQMRVLLLRRTFRELESNHILDAQLEAPEMGAECVPSAKVVRYPNGSQLQFGHCETAADAANYLSSEYDLIIFDELVTFEEVQFLLISSRARSTKAGWVPKVLAGTNPGGPQSHWVRMRFLDKTVDRDQYPDYVPEDWQFIPSKLEDNPYLDRHYERKLLALPPELRKAYRDGDWDIFPGQYFPEWRKARHITAEPVVYPSHVERVLSMDWGFVKPGTVGWWVLVDGHAYREDEYVFTRTTAFDVGQEIARRCKERTLTRIKYLVFDTAMEIPQNDSGESTIETVRRGLRAGGLSIATVQADKDRINGWQRFRHWLGTAPDGTPWLQSSPECRYFNRTIPSLVSDSHKPEDVDTDGEDHAADDGRYFVMSRPTPGTYVPTEPVKEWSLGWLKARSVKPRGLLAGREAHVA